MGGVVFVTFDLCPPHLPSPLTFLLVPKDLLHADAELPDLCHVVIQSHLISFKEDHLQPIHCACGEGRGRERG